MPWWESGWEVFCLLVTLLFGIAFIVSVWRGGSGKR